MYSSGLLLVCKFEEILAGLFTTEYTEGTEGKKKRDIREIRNLCDASPAL